MRESLLDRVGAAIDGRMRHMTNRNPRLMRQPPANIRICHWRQRMVFHARLRQEPVMDEEMALIDRPPIGWKGGTYDREGGVQRVEQHFGDRADIPAGVESKVEQYLKK